MLQCICKIKWGKFYDLLQMVLSSLMVKHVAYDLEVSEEIKFDIWNRNLFDRLQSNTLTAR